MKQVKPKIGLLALTLELYETLSPQLRMNRENWVKSSVVPKLQQDFDVVFNHAVYNTQTISDEIRCFEQEKADAIVVLFLCYSPSQVALPALQQTSLPIVIWNTQELFAVDENYSGKELNENHGVHGTHDLGNVLCRSGVPFEIFTSHLSDDDPFVDMRDYLIAIQTVNSIRGSKFALIGYPFPGMGDFAVDTTKLVCDFGASYGMVSVEEYIKRSANAESQEVEKIVGEYRALYDVAPDLTDLDLQMTARSEIAFRQIVQERELSGLTYQFTAFGEDERTSTVPFVAISRLMGEGLGFGGEGDLVATTATTMFNRLSRGAATFSEIFTTDFAGNALFFSHMGESNISMARKDRKIPLVARPGQITKTLHRQLSLVTSIEPGLATFCVLALTRDGYKIIMSLGEIEDFGPLPQLCVPHCKFRLDFDVRDFLSDYVRQGGPHHNALCLGDVRKRLLYLADLIDAEIVEL